MRFLSFYTDAARLIFPAGSARMALRDGFFKSEVVHFGSEDFFLARNLNYLLMWITFDGISFTQFKKRNAFFAN